RGERFDPGAGRRLSRSRSGVCGAGPARLGTTARPARRRTGDPGHRVAIVASNSAGAGPSALAVRARHDAHGAAVERRDLVQGRPPESVPFPAPRLSGRVAPDPWGRCRVLGRVRLPAPPTSSGEGLTGIEEDRTERSCRHSVGRVSQSLHVNPSSSVWDGKALRLAIGQPSAGQLLAQDIRPEEWLAMSEPFGSPKASGKESRMVRKRGFEPLRYCYRQ